MTSPYLRETRAAALADLPERLRAAILARAEQHQLDLTDARCWRTRSENPAGTGLAGRLLKRRANPVDKDAVHETALVLHPTYLLIGIDGEHRGTSVLTAPLHDLEVTRGSALRPGEATDDGISITGFVVSGPDGGRSSYFLGLGSPDGAGAEEALVAAIAGAKRG